MTQFVSGRVLRKRHIPFPGTWTVIRAGQFEAGADRAEARRFGGMWGIT